MGRGTSPRSLQRAAPRLSRHWTQEINEFPEEGGFWSVTTAEDVHTVSRDWQTYSSEVGGVTVISRSSRWS